MKHVMVIEISNVTDEQIQIGLGKAFTEFCNEYQGAGITANILSDHAGKRVVKYINEEAI
ncbi:hypothetical protein [Sporosarcina sp. ITBMC105]